MINSTRYAEQRQMFHIDQPHLLHFAHFDFIICADLHGYHLSPCHLPARRQDWAQWCLNQINTEDDKKLLIPDIPTTSGLWFRVSFHKIFCWKIAIQQEVKLINRKCNNRNNVLPTFTFENRRVPGSLMTACYAKFHLNCFYIFTQMIY